MTIIVLVLLAIPGQYYYMNVQGNVLDRIKRNQGSLSSFRKTKAFGLKGYNWNFDSYDFMGFLTLRFKKEYLKQDCYIGIRFIKDSDLLVIQNVRRLSETQKISLRLSYDYKEKIIIYEPINIYVSTSDIKIINDKERVVIYIKKYSITEKK